MPQTLFPSAEPHCPAYCKHLGAWPALESSQKVDPLNKGLPAIDTGTLDWLEKERGGVLPYLSSIGFGASFQVTRMAQEIRSMEKSIAFVRRARV